MQASPGSSTNRALERMVSLTSQSPGSGTCRQRAIWTVPVPVPGEATARTTVAPQPRTRRHNAPKSLTAKVSTGWLEYGGCTSLRAVGYMAGHMVRQTTPRCTTVEATYYTFSRGYFGSGAGPTQASRVRHETDNTQGLRGRAWADVEPVGKGMRQF
ncbi:hypothetical protein OH76DRAFT_1233369 [Lentinus brumalis]|uniref:Uncharacterized protein n=1 Tax=Lentinus brumalis TaxID=2498619 RepID=A0A371CSG2_9APHY|nr:hypothetical protein OH76DRAFT_1233369 [Polyporus brumalis]